MFLMLLLTAYNHHAEMEIIKLSTSGICHSIKSPYYELTKNYTPYYSIDACIKAGGRLPSFETSKRVQEPPTSVELINLHFSHWDIVYNCEKRGYQSFHYITLPDSGNIERYSKFHSEMKLPAQCRQYSASSYKTPQNIKTQYDRGHGVHQNIWDHNLSLMIESNSMANIVPQASDLNRRGVWRKTEELTECWRDYGPVEVWGGVIWGNDTSNDYFVNSHGVVTPDYLWKVIKYPDGEVNAWLMPNNNTPTAEKLDSYLISPKTLTKLTSIEFRISRSEQTEQDSRSKPKPVNCSLK